MGESNLLFLWLFVLFSLVFMSFSFPIVGDLSL